MGLPIDELPNGSSNRLPPEFAILGNDAHFKPTGAIRDYLEQFYQNKTLPFFEKLIEQGKKEGYIDPSISMEAAMVYIQLFKEALARPGFLRQASESMLLDLNRLFYFGFIGRSPGNRV